MVNAVKRQFGFDHTTNEQEACDRIIVKKSIDTCFKCWKFVNVRTHKKMSANRKGF